MSDGILEVRDTVHPDGTVERAYRIGTREWVTCTSFEHSTVHVDDGPWLTLEDVPEGVNSLTDHDGTRWVRDRLGWMCIEPVRYESRVYAPFALHGARKVATGGEGAANPVEQLKWTPPKNPPSWYVMSEWEFNR